MAEKTLDVKGVISSVNTFGQKKSGLLLLGIAAVTGIKALWGLVRRPVTR